MLIISSVEMKNEKCGSIGCRVLKQFVVTDTDLFNDEKEK